MFRNILTGAAALALVTGATAQQKQQMTVNKATTPQYAGSFHPATGLVNNSGSTAKFGPEAVFNNNVLTNYYSVPGAGQEWIDEGTLADRNMGSADQVNGINFTYCSAVIDPTQNSVSSTLRFYSESGYCTGPTLWPAADCAYGLAGLPGGDANGALQCWIFTVDLTNGFECDLNTAPATNLFGWSNTYDQADTGPWLASGGTGNTDSFVWYDAAAGNGNEFLGCFWFGGPPANPFAGFAGILYGNPTNVLGYASATPGADDNVTLMAMNEVLVGGSADFQTLDGPFGAAIGSRLFAAAASTDTDLSGLFGIDAHLLADFQNRAFDSSSATGVHTIAGVPAAAGGGKTWYLQAGVEASPNVPSRMSNGLQIYIP